MFNVIALGCTLSQLISYISVDETFFSAGGTALVILLGMCGILLNISKSMSKV